MLFSRLPATTQVPRELFFNVFRIPLPLLHPKMTICKIEYSIYYFQEIPFIFVDDDLILIVLCYSIWG